MSSRLLGDYMTKKKGKLVGLDKKIAVGPNEEEEAIVILQWRDLPFHVRLGRFRPRSSSITCNKTY